MLFTIKKMLADLFICTPSGCFDVVQPVQGNVFARAGGQLEGDLDVVPLDDGEESRADDAAAYRAKSEHEDCEDDREGQQLVVHGKA